jgi:Flp pilus assembly protein TadD
MDAASVPRSVALVQARAWTEQKRWDKVVALIPQLLAENPNQLNAYLLATRAQINAGNPKMGMKLASECIRLGPNNVDAYYMAAVAAKNLGLMFGAQKHLSVALALNPNWAPLHRLQAHIHLAMQREDRALESLRLAKMLKPESPEITGELVQLESIGLCLPSEARETTRQYQEALALDPNNPTLHFKLGLHLLDFEGDYSSALQNLTTALNSSPGNVIYQQAYLRALRHTDPLFRFLDRPNRLAKQLYRLALRKHNSTREKAAWLPLIIPMWVLGTASFMVYSFCCWIPALLYGRLSLKTFLERANIQTFEKNRLWQWSLWRTWLYGLIKAVLAALPLILFALIIWHAKVVLLLVGGVFVSILFDTAWLLGKWVRQGWDLRHRQRGSIIAILRFAAALVPLGVLIWIAVYDWPIALMLIIYCGILLTPATIIRWNRG